MRCASKAFLQSDHVEPRRSVAAARPTRAGCSVSSTTYITQNGSSAGSPSERAIDLRQRKSQPAELGPAEQKRQKLLAALLAQGFKKTESKQVVANGGPRRDHLSMEELLRRAFALLVPG